MSYIDGSTPDLYMPIDIGVARGSGLDPDGEPFSFVAVGLWLRPAGAVNPIINVTVLFQEPLLDLLLERLDALRKEL